jgi:hypothetical protein
MCAKRQDPRSRFSPKPEVNMRLEERDEQFLVDLFHHRLMSRGQIEKRYFSSLVRCNARMRQLFDHQFVARYYPPYSPYGAQAIYSIGKAALPVVSRRLEMELPEVARYYRRTQTPTFIEHTLSVVDLWLAFHKAVESEPDISLELWLSEMQCRHEWDIQIPGKSWHKEAFKPDAFVRLRRLSDNALYNFFIESDLGHTSATQFKGKLLTHARYLESGLFEQTYGCNSFRTIVVTTGERRLKNLKELAGEHSSQIFWFATFERIAMSSLLGNIWGRPGARNDVALVPS